MFNNSKTMGTRGNVLRKKMKDYMGGMKKTMKSAMESGAANATKMGSVKTKFPKLSGMGNKRATRPTRTMRSARPMRPARPERPARPTRPAKPL